MTPRTWSVQLIGGLLLLLLLLFMTPKYTPLISNIVLDKVKQNLQKNDLAWVDVQVNDRNITLSGNAPSIAEHNKAMKTSQSVWMVRNIQDSISPVIVEPYTMNIHWDKKQLLVDGYLSSDDIKSTFEENISHLFDQQKTDLTVGAGAPKHWDELTSILLKQIKTLQLASVRIVDKTVQLSGRASSNKEIEALEQTVSNFSKQGYSFSTQLVSEEMPFILCQRRFKELLENDKIKFTSGLATLAPESERLLNALGDTAALCIKTKLTIVGYTDNRGSIEGNLILSEKRAKAVLASLFQQGIPLNRLQAVGKGIAEPISTNETEEGRYQNRRIELLVERY